MQTEYPERYRVMDLRIAYYRKRTVIPKKLSRRRSDGA